MNESRIHKQLWPASAPVVGMIHLQALPGAPDFCGSMASVVARARDDAKSLMDGGVDGLLVENYGDRPYYPGPVPPFTLTAMATVVSDLVAEVSVPVGVNVLRNDPHGALSLAAGCGARFIRVNVHTGSMFTDQGLIHGQAHETLRLRQRLCPEVAILADVFVKHASPPPGLVMAEAARDAWLRGRADGLILTGPETGKAVDRGQIPKLRAALPEEAYLWAGSGVDETNAMEIHGHVDGLIIGSAFQRGGLAGNPVDPGRVKAVMTALGRG